MDNETRLTKNGVKRWLRDNGMGPTSQLGIDNLVKDLPFIVTGNGKGNYKHYLLSDVVIKQKEWVQVRTDRQTEDGEQDNEPQLLELKKKMLQKKFECIFEDLQSMKLDNEGNLISANEVSEYITHLQLCVTQKLTSILLNEMPVELAGKDTSAIRQICEQKINLILDMFKESLEKWIETYGE
jgi:hypothetical protein